MSEEVKSAAAATSPVAQGYITWAKDGEVKIRMGPEGSIANKKPETVIEVFKDRVSRYANEGALHTKRDGGWHIQTWKDYYDNCRAFAKSLLSLGFERFDAVSIVGFNSWEWLTADIGCIFAGGFAAGIYTTNNPPACQYIAEHAGARVIVCDGIAQLKKIASIADQLPKLKALVVYNATVPADFKCAVPSYDFQAFLDLGAFTSDDGLEARMAAQRPGHCCTLIYTSGTTGNPKAVMISHDNITWTMTSMMELFAKNMADPVTTEDRIVSYLPLSHVAAQLLDIHLPIYSGAKVYFAQPDALKGSLGQTLKDVRPTRFLGVPRVWEKIAEKMWEIGKSTKGVKKSIATWAKKRGKAKTDLAQFGQSGGIPCGYSLANAVVLKKVKDALGLDKCRFCAVGAAPLSTEILTYFGSLDIPIYDLFGQSECTGPQSLNYPGHWKIGSVGRAIPGTEWMVTPDSGELIFRGRNTMMGYLGSEAQTKAAIDNDGWLHSGDIAKIDHDGFGSITGRIKELIITAGGENIPPVLIEDVIKEELPLLSNVMVVGDKRKFLAALFTLRVNPDTDGAPTHTLDKIALDHLATIGSTAKSTAEAIACEKVQAYLHAGLKRANGRATSRAQNISKFHVLETDFSIVGGELTPTLKLKRATVMTKYSDVIEAMYKESNTTSD